MNVSLCIRHKRLSEVLLTEEGGLRRCVISWTRSGRLAGVVCEPKDVLAYFLNNPQSNTRGVNAKCCIPKIAYFTTWRESGLIQFVQHLCRYYFPGMLRGVTIDVTASGKKLGSRQRFLLTLFGRMRHILAVMVSIIGRTLIIEPWKIMHVVYQFLIRCVVLLMFGVVFLSTA